MEPGDYVQVEGTFKLMGVEKDKEGRPSFAHLEGRLASGERVFCYVHAQFVHDIADDEMRVKHQD